MNLEDDPAEEGGSTPDLNKKGRSINIHYYLRI